MSETLDHLLLRSSRRKVALPPAVAVRIALDALAALRADGDREVTSESIVVGEDGVARLAGEVRRAGHVLIDPARGRQIDRRADLFAIGVVLVECLEAGDGTVPPGVAAVCTRALDRDVARRHRSATEMAAELERAAQDAGALATHEEVAAHLDLVSGAVSAPGGRRRDFAVGSDMMPPARTAPPPPPVAPARRRASAGAIPERFGRYVVTRHIATGGMAEVYLATASGIEGFEKTVVIKRLKPSLAATGWATEMFLQEARVAATLEHPNIAQVHDVGEIDGSYFFAMEHVHGQDLRRILRTARERQRPIPLEDAVRVISDVCAALHYAHEKCGPDGRPLGLVHRDVSPSNVLVSYDGGVKLCDFGIAELNAAREHPEQRVRAGKLSYMSPEQCRGEPLDRRSDVFLLGVVLYELTTSTKLFQGKSEREVMRQVIAGRVRAPSAVCADYPVELERILFRALRVDPSARYATAQEMLLDLEAFARERRLATSAVGLARLMDELFPTAERDEVVPLLEPTDGAGSSGVVATSAPRMWHRAWLGAAVLAAAAAAALFAGERRGPRPGDDLAAATATAADRMAARLGTRALDVRTRAEAIGATPMLRAAITTDPATLTDMMTHEALFAPRPGEVVELYRREGDRVVSLLRAPAGAPATAALAGGTIRVTADGDGFAVTAAARLEPVYQERAVEGALVIASRVDRAELAADLPSGVVHATLHVGGRAVELARSQGGRASAPARVALPAVAERPALELVVAGPVTAAGRAPLARWTAIAAALLFAAFYLIGRHRTRWWRKRSPPRGSS